MIDRQARNELEATISAFLADRIGASEFGHRVETLQSKDEAVRFVFWQVWGCYDDFKDHLVHLDKRGWDTIQRLRLLLASDADVRTKVPCLWHASQIVAMIVLAAVAISLRRLSIDWRIICTLGGLASMALTWWRRQALQAHVAPDPWHADPFPSLATLESAVRSAPAFRKARYRPEISGRRIRSPIVHWLGIVPGYAWWGIVWCLSSPLPLILQCLPIRLRTTLTMNFHGRS